MDMSHGFRIKVTVFPTGMISNVILSMQINCKFPLICFMSSFFHLLQIPHKIERLGTA